MMRKTSPLKNDVSDGTIIVMLVVVIVVSLLSLGVYIFALDSTSNTSNLRGQAGSQSEQGVVSLTILPPPESEVSNSRGDN
jgi:flagellar basal body-associated protein FliL